LKDKRKSPRQRHRKSNAIKLGSRAHQRLLANSPQYKRAFLEEQGRTKQWLRKTKREINDLLRSSNSLRRLEEAGVIRERILQILALEVRGRCWLRDLRLTKANLKSLANRLRSLADEVQRTYGDNVTYLEFWLLALQQDQKRPPIPASRRIPRSLIREMGSRAKELDDMARKMGNFLQRATPVARRQPLTLLLAEVHARTGNLRRHLVPLSEILLDVYERYGIKSKVSDYKLAKHFSRHVKFKDKTPS
jgi:hypothetical protein